MILFDSAAKEPKTVKLPDNRLIAWGTVAGALLTAGSLLFAGIVYETKLRDDATASTRSDLDHETRLRSIEAVIGDVRVDVRETKTDVAWIRRFLDRPAAGHKEPPQTAFVDP